MVANGCTGVSSVLGGYNELGRASYLRKTFSGLCTHVSIALAFVFDAIDAWRGESAMLYVDGVLVWSETFSSTQRMMDDERMMVCSSSASSAPSCTVTFSNVASSSQQRLTIDVRNSDFDSSSEYISSVRVGSQSMSFLDNYRKADCGTSRIMDSVLVPSSQISASGQLTVSIATSSGVNVACDSYYLYAEITLIGGTTSGSYCGESTTDERAGVMMVVPHSESQMTVEFRTTLGAGSSSGEDAWWGLSFFLVSALCSGQVRDIMQQGMLSCAHRRARGAYRVGRRNRLR